MLQNIENISQVEQNPFDPFKGRIVSQRDLKKFGRGKETAFFGDTTSDFLEISVFNQQRQLVDWKSIDSFKIDEEGKLLLPTYSHLDDLDLLNETSYILKYEFLRKVFYPSLPQDFSNVRGPRRRQLLRKNLGSEVGMKLVVDEVSQTRQEIRVRPKLIGSEAYDIPFQETFVSFFNQPANGKELRFVLNFGNDTAFHAVNWTIDRQAFPEYPNSVVLKTYETIPPGIEQGDECWINEEVFPAYVDRVRFVQKREEEPNTVLRGPDFSVDVDGTDLRDTGVQTWESLLDSQEETSGETIEQIFENENSVDLNVNYSEFENFVKFSSAKERVLNFEYKLGLIEKINQDIDEILVSSGSVANPSNPIEQNKLQRLRDRKSTLIEGLDGFETFLFESEEIRDSSGNLLPTTDIAVQNFLEEYKREADLYDRNNDSSLQTNLPEYIKTDDRNENFELFISMIGHYFDIIYTYIKHVQYIKDRSEDIEEVESLSKDLTQFVTNSFGFEVYNGFSEQDLQKVLIGGENEAEDVQKQIWRRVLNNVPYIGKTKGTRRSVQALLSMYGVPKIGLTVREYGGGSSEADPGFFEYEDETSALEFMGSQNVEVEWDFPDDKIESIEARFRSEYKGSSDLRILRLESSGGDVLTVDLKKFLSPSVKEEFGYVEMNVNGNTLSVGAGADKVPIFDGNFNSLNVNYNPNENSISLRLGKVGELGPYEFDSPKTASESVTWYFEDSAFDPGFDLSSGETLFVGESFRGEVDNVKVWRGQLDESKFKEHVLAPYKYDYDNKESILGPERKDLDIGLNRFLYINLDFSENDLQNESPNQTNPYTGTISENGYMNVSEDFVNYNRLNYVTPLKIGSLSNSSTKIRIEESNLLGSLSPTEKRERGEFDLNRKDSNKIGVYFSPNEAVNRDINALVGYDDLNDLLADPENLRRERYKELESLNKKYWKKYPDDIDWNAYFRYIDQFNRAFFKQLQNIIPARSSLTYGSLLEPHFLERYRAKNTGVTKEDLQSETDIDVTDNVALPDSNYLTEETFSSVVEEIKATGFYPTYTKGESGRVLKKSQRDYRFAGTLLDSTKGRTRQDESLYTEEEFWEIPPEENVTLRIQNGDVLRDGEVFGTYNTVDANTVEIFPNSDVPSFETSYNLSDLISNGFDDVVTDIPGYRNWKSLKRFRRVPFKQTIQFINPITNPFEYSHLNYFQVFGFGFAYGDQRSIYGSAVYSTVNQQNLVQTPFGEIQPPVRPYKLYRHYIFNREFRTSTKRMKYEGVKWNAEVDGPAVEVTETTSDRLIVSPSDREGGEGPVLDVE